MVYMYRSELRRLTFNEVSSFFSLLIVQTYIHLNNHHKFHKLFNKNTVKISYSCTRNTESIINSHNAKILFPKKSTEQRTCNCLNKVNCPLEQKCLTTNIVYKAKITSSNQNYQEKVYFGSCETIFKK